MKESLYKKLENLLERHEEVAALLSDPETIGNQDKFRALSKEYAELEELVATFRRYQIAQDDLETARQMLEEDDAEMREMAQEEISIVEKALRVESAALEILLLPKDPNDARNVYLEIRAGTGGDEAGIFAGDLFRMYSKYAEKMGWRVEVVSENVSEQGGYKEIVSNVSGDNVYGRLKFESGAHRVQRVPETESQGRIHTSACTVAVMPEVDELEEISINPADLKIDTFRASGAGGQHVNKTDSAIRITHIPTGVVVECQEERSQHKNKAKALSVLQARLNAAEIEKQQAQQASERRNLVGSGDRSERIRTYNYPQGRVTDHRINMTLYKLFEVMEGDLSQVLDPLAREHQADLLSAMSDD